LKLNEEKKRRAIGVETATGKRKEKLKKLRTRAGKKKLQRISLKPIPTRRRDDLKKRLKEGKWRGGLKNLPRKRERVETRARPLDANGKGRGGKVAQESNLETPSATIWGSLAKKKRKREK